MYAKFGAKFEIFSEIGTMHKVMEHFLLVWTRTDKNGFIMNTFRGMPSFVPKFAFLVVENGLRNPPI